MLEIRAYVAVPVLRVGQIVAFLAVNHTKPHAWTAVESARAKVSLRASEEKYCALFGQMDEAYAVIELLADAAGHWMDCRFLEVNLAFMWHMGMLYPVGRTAAEMLGTPKPRWA